LFIFKSGAVKTAMIPVHLLDSHKTTSKGKADYSMDFNN